MEQKLSKRLVLTQSIAYLKNLRNVSLWDSQLKLEQFVVMCRLVQQVGVEVCCVSNLQFRLLYNYIIYFAGPPQIPQNNFNVNLEQKRIKSVSISISYIVS